MKLEVAHHAETVYSPRSFLPSPLGWLETSIRAYSKYVDVAAKVTATQQDEQELLRRERMAIDEVRSLLAEMLTDNDKG